MPFFKLEFEVRQLRNIFQLRCFADSSIPFLKLTADAAVLLQNRPMILSSKMQPLQLPFDKCAITEYLSLPSNNNFLQCVILSNLSSFPGFIRHIFLYVRLVPLFNNCLSYKTVTVEIFFTSKSDFDNY